MSRITADSHASYINALYQLASLVDNDTVMHAAAECRSNAWAEDKRGRDHVAADWTLAAERLEGLARGHRF